MSFELLQGDCIELLKTLPEQSVQCVVTSPPYYGLRDYGVDGQIGLESTPDEYVSKLVQVFREVKRALKDDGTCWINLGDSYAGGAGRWGGTDNLSGFQAASKGSVTQIQHTKKWEHETIKQKDLIGIPWMVAFALRADGWYLRSDIIWAKPNPMPESVKDRPTKSHEYLFLLSKAQKYYYDAEAIFEPANYDGRKDTQFKGSNKYDADTLARVGGERWPRSMQTGATGEKHSGYKNPDGSLRVSVMKQDNTGNPTYTGFNDRYKENHPDGIPARNKRTVWTINTQPFKGAHFAVMPEKLVEPCILAGSKEGDTVLDPFNGSGTVGAVAVRNGRSYKGIDLNGEYIQMAHERIFCAQQQMRLAL